MTAYWSQFSQEEILSLHGIDEFNEDALEHDLDDPELEEDDDGPYGCSMDSLGLSWRDFF